MEGVVLNYDSGGCCLCDEDGSSSFVELTVAARDECAVLDDPIRVVEGNSSSVLVGLDIGKGGVGNRVESLVQGRDCIE